MLAGCLLWGVGLVVAGQMRDIGQNVLKSFETGSSGPGYCHILFRIAFLDERFIRNMIIIQIIM